MITVKIPAPLRPLVGNHAELQLESKTVGEAIEELERRHPGIRSRLLDDKGALRRYVNVFVNDRDARELGALGAALKSGDRVQIVPAIAGGA